MVLGLAIAPRILRRPLRILISAIVVVAATWAFLGSAPTPHLLNLGCGLLTLLAVIFTLRRSTPRRQRMAASIAAIVLILLAVGIELRYAHSAPLPPVNARRLYVIGDSLSSWVADGGNHTWPQMVAGEHGLELIDLSVGGSTTHSQLQNIRNVQFQPGMVILEIGGNDMFTHRPLKDFEEDLELLVAKTAAPDRVLVMIELPHWPTDQGYPAVQRRLARRHGIALIPRRSLSNVLVVPGATIADGFHLTQAGHRIMADFVWSEIGGTFAEQK